MNEEEYRYAILYGRYSVQELYDRLIDYLNIHDDHPELTIELLDEIVERLQRGEKLDG